MEQHKNLGALAKHAGAIFNDLYHDIAKIYGETNPCVQDLKDIRSQIMHWRWKMDDELCKDYPGPGGLDADGHHSCDYWGGSQVGAEQRWHLPPDDPRLRRVGHSRPSLPPAV